MFNTDLAVRTLAAIENSRNHPELPQWGQDRWAKINDLTKVPMTDFIVDEKTGDLIGTGTCGTAMCFAGWSLSLSGVRLRWEPMGPMRFEAEYTEDGEEVAVAAVNLFGIDNDDDRWDEMEDMPKLFRGDNDMSDLYDEVALLAGLPLDEVHARVEAARAKVKAPQ